MWNKVGRNQEFEESHQGVLYKETLFVISPVAVSVREVSYCGLISIALTASIAAPILVEIFLAGGICR